MPRPLAIVCTSAYYFEHFLAPCLQDTPWDFDLLRVDPRPGIHNLLAEITPDKIIAMYRAAEMRTS